MPFDFATRRGEAAHVGRDFRGTLATIALPEERSVPHQVRFLRRPRSVKLVVQRVCETLSRL